MVRKSATVVLFAAVLAACGSDGPPPTEEPPASAQAHPDWYRQVNLCDQAMVDSADSAAYGSAQHILGSPSMAFERRAVCGQLLECQWQETGTPVIEFTVKSRRGYEDCYDLVFSQFE